MPQSNGSRHGRIRSPRRIRSRIRYLPCRVEPGMFTGEFLVFLKGLDPENVENIIPIQMLVDQREVEKLSGKPQRNKPVEGWVKVTLANQQGGVAEVVLPQPAQPVGENMLVEASDLMEVAGYDPVRSPDRKRH